LIFLDFDKGLEEEKLVKKPSRPFSKIPLSKVRQKESRDEKLKRLTAQIEAGEYEVDCEKTVDALLESLSEAPESD